MSSPVSCRGPAVIVVMLASRPGRGSDASVPDAPGGLADCVSRLGVSCCHQRFTGRTARHGRHRLASPRARPVPTGRQFSNRRVAVRAGRSAVSRQRPRPSAASRRVFPPLPSRQRGPTGGAVIMGGWSRSARDRAGCRGGTGHFTVQRLPALSVPSRVGRAVGAGPGRSSAEDRAGRVYRVGYRSAALP